MKKIILIVLVLLAVKLSFSQNDSCKRVYDVDKWKMYYYPKDYMLTDSLIIFGLNYRIIIATTDFKYLTDERTQLDVMIKDFQSVAAGKLEKLPDYPRSRITYNLRFGSLITEELDYRNRVHHVFKGDTIYQKPFP